MGVNYAGVMATRKNSYFKHFTPSTATVDDFEARVQEFLSVEYAGENVFIRIEREGKRPQSRLWEWNMAEMLHGMSAKTWLQEKLKSDFEYSSKEVKEYFEGLTLIKVKWDEDTNVLGVVNGE